MIKMPELTKRMRTLIASLTAALVSACAPLPLGIPGDDPERATDARPVLVVNSDDSIARYQIPAASFAAAMRGHPVVTLDLHDRIDPVETLQDYLNEYAVAGVYAVGAKALGAVNYLAPEVPVVYSAVLAWREFQRESDAHGIASDIAPDAQLIWFRHFFPDIKRLGLLYSDNNSHMLDNAIAAAKRTGLTLVPRRVAHAHSQAEQLQRLLEDVDALWLISDPTVLSSTESITNLFAQADQKKVPVFSYKRLFVDYGATLSITADEVTSGRQAAVMLHQLMHADKPLPAVQFPAGSAITLNLDRVRRYQLNLNRTALDSVRELVDSTR